MLLKKIGLFAFKNYADASLEFSDKVNCIVGENGSGKTNLLDAIHYLSLTKSAVNSVDAQNILHGEQLGTVNGVIEIDGENHQVLCGLQKGQKKVVKVNQSEYEKLSEHIGRFPVVLIAPNDTDIIQNSSNTRRRFFDSILSQINPKYLGELIQYNHYLKQRNSLLRQLALSNNMDMDLLLSYDYQLIKLGKNTHKERHKFVEEYIPLLTHHYQNLSEGKEVIELEYMSQVAEKKFEENFNNSLQRDLVLQRTNVGIHKDEYLFKINDRPIKKFGSQGQQKSFLIAMKLAQFDIIKNIKNIKPLLLLDDIFDKLDDFRIKKLVEMVANDSFGQLFITDARPERSRAILDTIATEVTYFRVDSGEVSIE